MKYKLLFLLCLSVTALHASDDQPDDTTSDAQQQKQKKLVQELEEAAFPDVLLKLGRSKSLPNLSAIQRMVDAKKSCHDAVIAKARNEGFEDFFDQSSGSSSDDEDDFKDVYSREAQQLTRSAQGLLFSGRVNFTEMATAASNIAGTVAAATYHVTGRVREVVTGTKSFPLPPVKEDDVVLPMAKELEELLRTNPDAALKLLQDASQVGLKDAIVRLSDTGFAPFHQALGLLNEKRVRIIEAMWRCHENFLNTVDGTGALVLNRAVQKQNFEEITFLVGYGADPEFPDKNGRKASALVVKALVNAGKTSREAIEQDPLYAALQKGKEEFALKGFERKVNRMVAKQTAKKS